MSLTRRKITLQLTPLLDMMLIVIFAQYMEVQIAASRQSQEAHAAVAKSEHSEQARRKEERSRARLQADLGAERARLREFEREAEQQRIDLAAALRETQAERDRLAALVAEWLKLDPQEVAKLLAAGSAEAREKLLAALQRLKPDERAAMLQKLLATDAVRKVSDVWDVYVADNNQIRVKSGDWSTSFRAESVDEFELHFLEWYRSLPPTRSLVVVTVSWGDAAARTREAVRGGIVRALERIRTDRGGKTVFEYVPIGYSRREGEAS